MIVGVALFEIHVGHAQSLKEKRMVVRSLRDKIRNRFRASVAEVAHQDLHQRARLGVAIVSNDGDFVRKQFDGIVALIESDADLVGWTDELIDFDAAVGLGSGAKWEGEKEPE
ncbi:MAG: DUF503 domain-containing protein [Thermoanaerobaculia bacterium]